MSKDLQRYRKNGTNDYAPNFNDLQKAKLEIPIKVKEIIPPLYSILFKTYFPLFEKNKKNTIVPRILEL